MVRGVRKQIHAMPLGWEKKLGLLVVNWHFEDPMNMYHFTKNGSKSVRG